MSTTEDPHRCVFVAGDEPVHEIPMEVIRRPLPSETDDSKVPLSFLV